MQKRYAMIFRIATMNKVNNFIFLQNKLKMFGLLMMRFGAHNKSRKLISKIISITDSEIDNFRLVAFDR